MTNSPVESLEHQHSTYTIPLSFSILVFNTLRNVEDQCEEGKKKEQKIEAEEKNKTKENKNQNQSVTITKTVGGGVCKQSQER